MPPYTPLADVVPLGALMAPVGQFKDQLAAAIEGLAPEPGADRWVGTGQAGAAGALPVLAAMAWLVVLVRAGGGGRGAGALEGRGEPWQLLLCWLPAGSGRASCQGCAAAASPALPPSLPAGRREAAGQAAATVARSRPRRPPRRPS
jgi:hypothetical protein